MLTRTVQDRAWRSTPCGNDATQPISKKCSFSGRSLSRAGCNRVAFDEPPEFNDLIPKERRFLEFEIARRGLHLGFEILHHPRDLVARQFRDDAGLAPAFRPVFAVLLG